MKIKDLRKIGFKDLKEELKENFYFPPEVEDHVRKIIENVYEKRDKALIEYTRKFDSYNLKRTKIKVQNSEIDSLSKNIDSSFISSIKLAIERVKDFHLRSLPNDWAYIDEFGNVLGQRYTPIENVGIYVPGGKAAYPSTIVMTAVIAHVAGVKCISVISPPSSFNDPSVISATIKEIGRIGNVYRIGGVHGIAALAFGTETVKKVDKIVGPGNLYVTIAKKILYGFVDIDMVAGPSEVLIIADGSIDVDYTAHDLIAQAEHDEEAKPICVTFDIKYAEKISNKVDYIVSKNPRRNIATKSLEKRGIIYVVKGIEEAVELVNYIAPEHLEIQTEDPKAYASKIKNAGAIFIGKNAAEAFGDYILGPSHVLPTGGTARFFSPLNIMSFYKISSIIEMSNEGVANLGEHASRIAKLEGLIGHANSINIRSDDNNGN